MDTPFTKAAKRGEAFTEEPMMEAFPSQLPRCSTYARQIVPVCARDPASARPNPSRIDFFPSSMTSSGISSYFVEAINFPTYSVKVGALGKSLPDAPLSLAAEPARAAPITLREALPKSRRNTFHLLFRTLTSVCSAINIENSDHHAGPGHTP